MQEDSDSRLSAGRATGGDVVEVSHVTCDAWAGGEPCTAPWTVRYPSVGDFCRPHAEQVAARWGWQLEPATQVAQATLATSAA